MDCHNKNVREISERVKEFNKQKKAFRIYHGSTHTTRRSTRSSNTIIDLTMMRNIVLVSTNTTPATALVEPNVAMDALVIETLKHDLIPPVVMEFPGITAGGAFAGTGGESSSFRWGTFDRIVNRIEIVLGNGDVVWASDQERADLFNGSAGAFGTLGILTLLEVQLIPAQGKVIELRYHPIHSPAEAVAKFQECCKDNKDWAYVDGIMYSNRCGVVITGNLLHDTDNQVTARYSRARDNWYYSDVQDKLEICPEGWVDIVPIEDYLFRYDRGAFWCARYTFGYLGLPFNSTTRWLLDGFMHTRDLFKALHATGSMIRSIIQDLCIPAANLDVFIGYTTLEFNIWPLWLCPMRSNAGRGIFQLSRTESEVDMASTDDLWINVGLWGQAPPSVDEAVAANQRLEQVVRDLGGYKWLYAQTFYTEDQFWKIYPKGEYDNLREKYHATRLPNAYEKVSTEVETEKEQVSGWKTIWPFDAIVAYLGAMKGGGDLG